MTTCDPDYYVWYDEDDICCRTRCSNYPSRCYFTATSQTCQSVPDYETLVMIVLAYWGVAFLALGIAVYQFWKQESHLPPERRSLNACTIVGWVALTLWLGIVGFIIMFFVIRQRVSNNIATQAASDSVRMRYQAQQQFQQYQQQQQLQVAQVDSYDPEAHLPVASVIDDRTGYGK